jgi:hypothetical protein
MARFYFDTAVGDDLVRDDEGLELAGLEAAFRAAAVTLGEIARDTTRQLRNETLTVQVRDSRGAPVIRARLCMQMEMLPAG